MGSNERKSKSESHNVPWLCPSFLSLCLALFLAQFPFCLHRTSHCDTILLKKTQFICSVISHGSGADLKESPLVCLVKENNRHTFTQAMNAMLEMVRVPQMDVRASAESKFLVKDKESMTTKRVSRCCRTLREKLRNTGLMTWRFLRIEIFFGL